MRRRRRQPSVWRLHSMPWCWNSPGWHPMTDRKAPAKEGERSELSSSREPRPHADDYDNEYDYGYAAGRWDALQSLRSTPAGRGEDANVRDIIISAHAEQIRVLINQGPNSSDYDRAANAWVAASRLLACSSEPVSAGSMPPSSSDRDAVIEECAKAASERADYWQTQMMRAKGNANRETRSCCAFKRDGANDAVHAIRSLKSPGG